MVQLTERQHACLRYLCQRTEFVTVETLACNFEVSPRTIRADLGAIESYLSASDVTLSRSAGRGIRLDVAPTVRASIVASLGKADSRVLSSAERNAVAEMMLVCYPVVTFLAIADYCGVSKQTVSARFAAVDAFFSSNGLRLVREPGVGSRVEGPEIDRRRCFLGLTSDDSLYDLLAPIASSVAASHIEEATKMVKQVELACDIGFANSERLQLAIAFMLSRAASGCVLEDGRDTTTDVDCKMQDFLVQVQPFVPTEAEAIFLVSILLSQRLSVTGGSDSLPTGRDDEAEDISRLLIDALGEIHEVDEASLEHVISGFTRHVRAALYRSRNGIKIQGEVPVQITSSIPLLYDFTRKQLAGIEGRYGVMFDENEVAYIAMYLDAIYETSVREAVALNVLFVCSFGLASSSILMTRLSHILVDCNVFGPLSAEGVGEFLTRNDIDLIVSTSGFSYPDVPVLEVDPILSQASLDAVKQGISNASYQKLCSGFLSAYSLSGDSSRHYVRDLVDPTAVQVGVSCMSWHEAIRLAACPLLRYGLIDKHYVDQMIAAVENYGPYMVLTPGVAYVHAGVDDGIKRNCIAVLVLNEPIDFGPSGESKRIRVVVVLGIRDKEQSELLNLASIFERGESIRAFERCTDVESILALHD